MLLAVLAIASSAGAAPEARAHSADDDTDRIIVTGERVKRTLKDTPSSVAVFDKRDLDRMAAPDRIQNLLEMIPNILTVTSRDAPIIRGQAAVGVLQGLPAFLGGARPRTVMQIDGRTFRQIQWHGFAPLLRLSVERNRSTIAFYDYRRTRTEMGIVHAF